MGRKAEGAEDRVEEQWRAAQLYLAKGPSATLEYMVEELRARLFAYRAQGLDGPCPPGQDGTLPADPTLRRKEEAWKALGDMPQRDAKKMFVQLLTEVSPEWKGWDEAHGDALRARQRNGGEADTLLQEFRRRTGAQLRSRL